MRIEQASAQDVEWVALNMRETDYMEFTAVNPTNTREELAELLTQRYGNHPDTLCAWHDGKPTCIGAGFETRPNVISLLFFGTVQFAHIGLPMTRWIKRELFPRYEMAGVHRIEAVSHAENIHAHAWIEALGLQAETEPLIGYGKHAEPFIQFSKVNDYAREVAA